MRKLIFIRRLPLTVLGLFLLPLLPSRLSAQSAGNPAQPSARISAHPLARQTPSWSTEPEMYVSIRFQFIKEY